MMKHDSILLLALGAAALTPPANAQAVDTSEWACEFCPFETAHEADVEIGASSVSDDSAYAGDASGYDEDGVYANVDGQGSYAGERHRLRWTIDDLGLDSRFAELRGRRGGRFDYRLAYRELPQRQFITASSVFNRSGADALSLPAGWVRAPLTSGFTALGASLAREDIESDRAVFELGGRYRPSSRFSFSADYRRQERDGSRIAGGSYFTNASRLPMPFDYATDEVDLGLRYGADQGFVSLRWYLSEFENDATALTWDNPFTSLPGAGTAALSRAPDNSFRQVSLAAGYSFREYRTTVSASVAAGTIEQDAAFLAYTTNAAIAADPLPRASLDGDVDTSNYAITVTSRLIDDARVKLSYRYDERDNKTAEALWNRVIVDSFLSGDAEANIPYSFERSKLELSADYDLFDTVRVSAGYERKTRDRDFQEVTDQDEDTGWGRVRWRPNAVFEIDARGGSAKRDDNGYDEALAAAFGQNPLLRKYHLAYRYREFGEATLTISPATLPFSITLDGLYADDSYTRTELGVTGGDELRIAADFNWSISETASAYLTAGIENAESQQSGSELGAGPDWHARIDDDFTTIGAGFRIREIAERIDLKLDYTHSDGSSTIDVVSSAGGPGRFPDLETELRYLRLKLAWRRSERLELALSLSYQRFTAEDWALQGVEPATIPAVLSLGEDPYDDDVFIAGLSFRYVAGIEPD